MNEYKIEPETVIRTIVLIVAVINNTLTMYGKNPLPISENELYQVLSTVAATVAIVWAWWKNNSFTKPAREADAYLRHLKVQKKNKEGSK